MVMFLTDVLDNVLTRLRVTQLSNNSGEKVTNSEGEGGCGFLVLT